MRVSSTRLGRGSSIAPVMGAVLLAGCGARVVPAGDVESAIRTNARIPLRSVSCAQDVPAEAGEAVVCQVAARDGSKGTVTVHITSASGTKVRYQITENDFHPAETTLASAVTSTDGSFSTVIPAGFKDAIVQSAGSVTNSSTFVYVAYGPPLDNYDDRITVAREQLSPLPRPPRGRQGIDTIVAADLPGLRNLALPGYRFSGPRALTVGGAQARAVDYYARPPPSRRLLHIIDVLVVHGGEFYLINYATPPADYAAHLGALEEVIGRWRWR